MANYCAVRTMLELSLIHIYIQITHTYRYKESLICYLKSPGKSIKLGVKSVYMSSIRPISIQEGNVYNIEKS